jgi:hypothetical protein
MAGERHGRGMLCVNRPLATKSRFAGLHSHVNLHFVTENRHWSFSNVYGLTNIVTHSEIIQCDHYLVTLLTTATLSLPLWRKNKRVGRVGWYSLFCERRKLALWPHSSSPMHSINHVLSSEQSACEGAVWKRSGRSFIKWRVLGNDDDIDDVPEGTRAVKLNGRRYCLVSIAGSLDWQANVALRSSEMP